MCRVLKIFLIVMTFIFGMVSMKFIDKFYQKTTPVDRLIALADGFLISRALYVVAQLGIADELVVEKKTAHDIAKKLDLNADALFRLLRMLAAHGVFIHDEDDTFSLNEIAYLITKNHPQTMHGFLLHEDEARWQAYGKMIYSIQTGKSTFEHVFNEGYFDYIAGDKKRSEQFDRGMASFSETENKQVARSFDFKSLSTIVDIGGGVGGLLVEILKNNQVDGVLYELSHLESMAHDYFNAQGLDSRIKFVTGSFLENITPGGDLYILKRILHDWDDKTCVKILQNCCNAMSDNSRIVIFDCIVPQGAGYDISKDIDLLMMVIFGGKERTEKDFEFLFNQAGLQINSITSVPDTMLFAIEGRKSNNSFINY